VATLAPFPGFRDDLLGCAARVLAHAQDGDLYFVGRSPESLHDFLLGLLQTTTWQERPRLLQFSARGLVDGRLPADTGREAKRAFHAYCRNLYLSPERLASAARPATLIDLVASGRTLGQLLLLLRSWCDDAGVDWSMARRKLRIVGITLVTTPSPHTWRWRQQADWVDQLGPAALRTVAVPEQLWCYLGNSQPKITKSYPAMRWGLAETASPRGNGGEPVALAVAHALYQEGKRKQCRQYLVRLMVRERAMRQPWYRRLVFQLRNGAGAST
jgi:hypothetical protein